MKWNSTIVTLAFLNGMKEGFFLILAPFLPDQITEKGVPDVIYTPIFMQYLFISIFQFLYSDVFLHVISGRKALRESGKETHDQNSLDTHNYISRMLHQLAVHLQCVNFKCNINELSVPYLWQLHFLRELSKVQPQAFSKQLVCQQLHSLIIAYSELLIQFPEIQEKLVSVLEFGAGQEFTFLKCLQDQGVLLVFQSRPLLLHSQAMWDHLHFVVLLVINNVFIGLINLFFSIFLDKFVKFAGSTQVEQTSDLMTSKVKAANSILQPQLKKLAHTHQKYSMIHEHNNAGSDIALHKKQTNNFSQIVHSNQQNTMSEHLVIIEDVNHNQVQQYDKLNYFHILFTTRGFFAALDIAMCCQMYNFCDTTLTVHFQETYGLKTNIISALYGVQGVAFISTCFVAPIVVKRFNLIACVIIAQYAQAFASYLIGPSQFFSIPDYLWITMLGFVISGLACPWTIVPPYRELELCLSTWKNKRFNPDDVQDIVSGVFNTAYAFGGLSGPLFGFYTEKALGFKTTADIQGLIMIALASIQLILVYIPMKIKGYKQPLEENAEQQNEIKSAEEKIPLQ